MMNAMRRNNAPAMKMDIIPNPSTKNPPIAIPKAIPPFRMLKNIPFASSGLSGITEASTYWIRLYPIPSSTPNIKINIRTGIK